MGAMKSTKKKAMKKVASKIAKGVRARAAVFAGGKEKTRSGLTKAMLTKSKTGKLVSKKAQAVGKKAFKYIAKWNKAVSDAKKALGVTGFVAIGGKTATGKAVYAKAKALYAGA